METPLWHYILFSLLFFFPAGLSNSAAVIAAKLPILRDFNQPVDFGMQFRGKSLLGSHKTFRGFIVGTLAAIGLTYVARYLYNSIDLAQEISQINYNEISPLLLGFLLGFGSLTGDSVKSFFKRRSNLEPGASWIPFDQIDYIIGAFVFVSFYLTFDFVFYVVTFILWFGLHIVFTVLGYLIGIKDKPI